MRYLNYGSSLTATQFTVHGFYLQAQASGVADGSGWLRALGFPVSAVQGHRRQKA